MNSKSTSSKRSPRKATAHKATSRKATSRKATSRKATSRKATSGKPASGTSASRKSASGKATARKTTTGKPSDRAKLGTSRRTSSALDPMVSGKGMLPGTERARDEQRDEPTPRYGGGPWSVADERGDARFGHARNDDADPSELAPREADNDDDDSPGAADPELAAAEAAGEIESGGQRAGMGRGDQPRKHRSRAR